MPKLGASTPWTSYEVKGHKLSLLRYEESFSQNLN